MLYIEGGFRLRDFLQASAFSKMEADIRMTMFDHIQSHSPKYFNEHFSGSLANKIGDMVSTVSVILRSILMKPGTFPHPVVSAHQHFLIQE